MPVLLLKWWLHLADEEVEINAQDVIQSIDASQSMIDLVPADVHLLPADVHGLLKAHEEPTADKACVAHNGGMRPHVYTVTRSGTTVGACCFRTPLSACRTPSTRSDTWLQHTAQLSRCTPRMCGWLCDWLTKLATWGHESPR